MNRANGTSGWKLGGVRLYASWNTNLFSASAQPPTGGSDEQRLMYSGHDLLLSIKPTPGQGTIPANLDTTGAWNFIAAGSADSDLATQVSALQSLITSATWNPDGRNIYLCYHHEMDGDGTASAFIAMWRHVVDYYQAHMSQAARAHLRWVWVPTAYGFTAASGNRAPTYYPGDAYVDYLGVDGYNRLPANNDTPIAYAGTYAAFGPDEVDATYFNGADIFGTFVSWTRANTGTTPGPSNLPPTAFGSKPMQVWEFGSWPMVIPPKTFPGATSQGTDFGTTTLAASLSASASSASLVLGSASGNYNFPKTGPYTVIVDPGKASEERIIAGAGGTRAVNGNTLINLSRTAGESHASGATVVLAEDKGDGSGTGMRARFFMAAGDQLERHWTDITYISYFDSDRGAGTFNQEWTLYARLSVNESGGSAWVADPDSLAGFAALAKRPYFGGP